MALLKYNCSCCHNEFERRKSDAEKTLNKSGKIFCSIICSKKHFREENKGKIFPENKKCTRCDVEKPRNGNFGKHKGTFDGLDSWCYTCRGKYRSEFRRGIYRSMISDEDLSELLKTKQCTICGSEENLVVDHDHKRNFVRGMLCNHCNRGLGHFRDDPMLLEFAKMYLMCYAEDSEDRKEFEKYFIENYQDEKETK
jgi:hypothetical protein